MDDVHIIGSTEAAIGAFLEIERRFMDELRLKVRPDKSIVYFGDAIPHADKEKVFELQFNEDVVTVTQANGTMTVAKGITTDGRPDGDPGYIHEIMTDIVDSALSKQKQLTTLLQDRSPQAPHTCLYYCLNPVLTHWMRGLPPDIMLPHCQRFQAGLDNVARVALHPDITSHSETEERIRLPARHGGLGLRNAADVRHAAYLGFLHMVLPTMVNHYGEGGALQRGFLHQVFGPIMAGHYNNGAINHTAWLASQSVFGDLPDHHQASYDAVRSLLPPAQRNDECMAPLHLPLARLGEGEENLQHAITVVLEDRVLVPPGMNATMNGLHATDQIRIAFAHTTGVHLNISMSFVTAWLCRIKLTPSEWREMIARVLGLPSPACAALLGQPIRGANKGGRLGSFYGEVDAHGDNVLKAQLPGDGWRKNHDYVKDVIAAVASTAGYNAETEIYRLFANQLSSANLQRWTGAQNKRQRSGIVPDLMLQAPTGAGGSLSADKVLYELKTLNRQYDRDGPPGSSNGTEKRAGSIYKEQLKKLQVTDKDVLSHPDDGTDGPLVRRLKGLNGPKPLVVGKYADVNQRMRRLLVEMAEACAVAKWQEMNYRNEATALARLKLHFRRIVGLACHKSQARLLLDRLNNLDGGAQRQKAFQRKSKLAVIGVDDQWMGQDEPRRLDDMRFNA